MRGVAVAQPSRSRVFVAINSFVVDGEIAEVVGEFIGTSSKHGVFGAPPWQGKAEAAHAAVVGRTCHVEVHGLGGLVHREFPKSVRGKVVGRSAGRQLVAWEDCPGHIVVCTDIRKEGVMS